MNSEQINVNHIEDVEKFKFIFNNINLMIRLQGLGNDVQDQILYSKTFNQLMWRNIHITFNNDNFDVNINKGISTGLSIYRIFVEKFVDDMPEDLNYVRLVNFSNCIVLKDVNYNDMDSVLKLIAECT